MHVRKSCRRQREMGVHAANLLTAPGASQGGQSVKRDRDKKEFVEPKNQRGILAQPSQDHASDVRAEVNIGLDGSQQMPRRR